VQIYPSITRLAIETRMSSPAGYWPTANRLTVADHASPLKAQAIGLID
jgi:hypothetical protein